MKKLIFSLLLGGLFLTGTVTIANAQFRKIPGAVTDTFKAKYPAAQGVSWSDKLTAFQASFTLEGYEYTAKFSTKGEWQGSEKKINEDQLPTAVKDGLGKSKYAESEWTKGTVTTRYLPGNQTQYTISVSKGTFNKRTLVFNPEGRLLKD